MTIGNTLIGATLGPYEIESLLGRGGMAIVYRAFDTTLQRQVAIKVLADIYVKSTGELQVEGIDRTPETWSLLRFELPRGIRPRRALVRLYAQNTARHGGAVYAVPAGWDSRVTWQSRPALGAQLAEIGQVKKGRWITFDVTGALQTGGVLALAIVPTSDHVASYHSAESSPSHAPRLVVEQ